MKDDEVEKMIESGTFADLLALAENFWALPQQTRLYVLGKTTIDPFVMRNTFDAFYRAFGFADYFAKYAEIRGEVNLARWKEAMACELKTLTRKMESELRAILDFQGGKRAPLKQSFCDNVESGRFLTPMFLAGQVDYDLVQCCVRRMMITIKYPEIVKLYEDDEIDE